VTLFFSDNITLKITSYLISASPKVMELIAFLTSVDQKEQYFVFCSTPRHLVVSKTLNTPISETGGPN